MGESSLLIYLGVINEKFFLILWENLLDWYNLGVLNEEFFPPENSSFVSWVRREQPQKQSYEVLPIDVIFYIFFFSIYLNKKGYISPKRVLRSPNSVRDALVFTRTRLQPPQNQRYPVLPELCAVSVFTLVRFKQPQEHRYPVLQVYRMFKCLPDGMKIWTVC